MAESTPRAPLYQPEDAILGMFRLNLSSNQATPETQDLSKFEVVMPQELQKIWEVKNNTPCLAIDVAEISIAGLCNVKNETILIYFKNVFDLSDVNQKAGNFAIKFVIPAGTYTLDEIITLLNNHGAGYYQFQFYTSTINNVPKKRLCLSTMIPPQLREHYTCSVLNMSASFAAKLGFCLAKTSASFQRKRYNFPLIPSSNTTERPVMQVILPPPLEVLPPPIQEGGEKSSAYYVLEIMVSRGPLPNIIELHKTILTHQFTIFGQQGFYTHVPEQATVFKKTLEFGQLAGGIQGLRMPGALPSSPLAFGIPLCNVGKLPQPHNLHTCYYAKYTPLLYSHLEEITLQVDSDNIYIFPRTVQFGSPKNLLAKGVLGSPLEEANTLAKYTSFWLCRTVLEGPLQTLKMSLYDRQGESIIIDPHGEVNISMCASIKMLENA